VRFSTALFGFFASIGSTFLLLFKEEKRVLIQIKVIEFSWTVPGSDEGICVFACCTVVRKPVSQIFFVSESK
jgi:hypothetical protein